jgi:hypothetical protein
MAPVREASVSSMTLQQRWRIVRYNYYHAIKESLRH